MDFDEEFSIFAGWNYFTNYNFIPGYFEEGESFPATVPLAMTHLAYPTGWIDTPKAIENLGIAYIYFENYGIAKADLMLEFRSDINYPEGLTLIALYRDRPIEFNTYSLEADENIVLQVADFNSCEGVVLAVSWPYQGYAIEDSAGYRYRAGLDTLPSAITANIQSQPDRFYLFGNYPNPFNLSCNIIFSWNLEPVNYTIGIYNIGGRQVEQLRGVAMTGLNEIAWTPKSDDASGVYYYRLMVGEKQAKAKMARWLK